MARSSGDTGTRGRGGTWPWWHVVLRRHVAWHGQEEGAVGRKTSVAVAFGAGWVREAAGSTGRHWGEGRWAQTGAEMQQCLGQGLGLVSSSHEALSSFAKVTYFFFFIIITYFSPF